MNTALTIIAIIAGPILAIQVQKIIERVTQRRDEKRRLFMTLMATREQQMLREHVQALNMIDIVFSGKNKKNKAVVGAWTEYRDHLNEYPRELSGKELTDTEKTRLQSRRDSWSLSGLDSLSNLLEKMAASLNYHFDKVFLKRGAYTPQGYGDDEFQQYCIRKGVMELFLGKPLPIRVVEVASTEGAEGSQKDTAGAQKVTAEEPKQK